MAARLAFALAGALPIRAHPGGTGQSRSNLAVENSGNVANARFI